MGNYQMFDSEANEQMNFGAFVFWYLLRQCKKTGVSSVSAWKEVPGMELSEKEQVAEQHEQYGFIYVKRKKQKKTHGSPAELSLPASATYMKVVHACKAATAWSLC